MVFAIAGRAFELTRESVKDALRPAVPEPVAEHYVVVGGRRYPPKQVIELVTGLDRADFTTDQARRILKRLGFAAARSRNSDSRAVAAGGGPYGGAQAAALAPFRGRWVALASPTEVLVAADTPQDVLAWLSRHERRASYGMLRVPAAPAEAEGGAPR